MDSSFYPIPRSPGMILTNAYLIPNQCFLFFPGDDFCFHGAPPIAKIQNKYYRRIFEGHQQLLPLEKAKLKEFSEYLTKEGYQPSSIWSEKRTMKTLYGEKFKFAKCLEAIKKFQRKQSDRKIQQCINILYGLYNNQFNAARLSRIMNICNKFSKNWNYESSNNCCFALKSLIANMQNNFNSRLGIMYMVNASKSISIPWAIVKPFIDSDTREKIKLTGDLINKEMFTHVNKDQLEIKHGGTQPNLEKGQYWPPIFHQSTNIIVDQKKISQFIKTKQEYSELYQKGILNYNLISKELIDPNYTSFKLSSQIPTNSQGIPYFLQFWTYEMQQQQQQSLKQIQQEKYQQQQDENNGKILDTFDKMEEEFYSDKENYFPSDEGSGIKMMHVSFVSLKKTDLEQKLELNQKL